MSERNVYIPLALFMLNSVIIRRLCPERGVLLKISRYSRVDMSARRHYANL